MEKILITSGCSFTEGDCSWPYWVSKNKGWELNNLGVGSQGNNIISKKGIHALNKFLSTNSSNDMVAGIMWSGINRHTLFFPDSQILNDKSKVRLSLNSYEKSPTSIDNGTDKNWIVLNHHWDDKISKLYYNNFWSEIGSAISTIESILLFQYFCEKNNISYFMTTYMDIFKDIDTSHKEIKYLYDQINFERFIPIDGCYEWLCRKDKDNYIDNTKHPTTEGSKKFSEEVIIPFISDID